MTSPDSDLSNTSTKLKDVSLASQQLLERKKFQCVFQELKKRVEFGRTEEAASNQHKSDAIDDKLEQRSERQAELQKSHDTVLRDSEKKTSIKKVSFESCEKIEPRGQPVSAPEILYIEPPPLTPAPKVILDVENLPPCPCRTQCPECRQYIMTETFSSISSVTWLLCFITAGIGYETVPLRSR
ncbi:lipopolysaccharide-induced tumor necrosis factor-alpha factor homolog isoform X2 [Scophthalmus maximus]|uniref:lipopolysaccharide-induced tumor necrosis factor-alpha factor homolog isoform X2 n=1 Tax=Scophthalmus maximus TaxID=52904 RepID=UPI0015E13397|nr:lipopolysaccharide-induced tumor necrosis factor-alpha factor homolog isoform X2 [Scophthalmus maximus]